MFCIQFVYKWMFKVGEFFEKHKIVQYDIKYIHFYPIIYVTRVFIFRKGGVCNDN